MTNSKMDANWEEQWLGIQKDTCDYAYKSIEAVTLTLPSIQGIIRHLPVIGVEESLSPEGYEKCLSMVSECLIRLWDYCKEMNFVDNDATLDAFIRSGLDFSFFKDHDALPYTHDVPREFEKLAQWIEANDHSLQDTGC